MRKNLVRRGWPPIAMLMFLAAAAFAVAPLVNATLEPQQIVLGDSAQLTITSSGTGMEPITLPEVSGLEFRVVGQSRRVELIRGATLATTSIIVRITPQTAGIFTIPGITPKSQPLVLRVSPDNGGAPPSGNLNSPNRPPVVAGGSTANGVRLTADGAAFIKLVLPKHDAYVGESIPVEIEVGMRSGVVTSLNGLPALTGGDFTLNNLSRQPERVEKLIDGTPFTLLTWHSVLAPVKPGNFILSVSSPLTVRVRTRPQRDSMIDDLLGDPFLQNFFGATVPKEITVTSPTAELEVLPLPDGRPRDFSGAVGTFKIASDLSATTAATGDPLTLRLHVSGSGNFDRVDSAMLDHVERWKTYPPKSSFAPGDTIGYKGEKTFEQPLVAAQPGTQTLPDLTFSYFDPSTRHYETARSAPPPVTITPSLADSTLTAPPTAAPGATAPPGVVAATVPPPPGLRPDHARTDDVTHTLIPPYLQPRFLALPSLLALLCAGGWLGLRRRAETQDGPKRRERKLSAAAAHLLTQLETAARKGNGALFFMSARAALQRHLTARWQVGPDQLAAEFARRGHDGEELRQLFALADEARYSGDTPTATDFDRWTHIVRKQLLANTP